MGHENLKRPPIYSLSLFGVLLAIISLSTFFTILQSDSAIPVYRDERFWVSLGVLISWSSTTFIYAGIVGDITINIWIVNNLLHTFGNLCYLLGYLWMQPQTIC